MTLFLQKQAEMTKNIVITGATSDIGFSIAKKFLSNGYNVILVGRSEFKLQKAVNDLGLDQKSLFFHDESFLDESNIDNLFNKIVDSHGKLDNLVCVSGIHLFTPMKIMKLDTIMEHFSVNTLSPILLSKYFSKPRYSNTSSQRSIVFISSTASILGEPSLLPYSASKGALIPAARTMAVELSSKKIRVNVISPGWVDTEHANIVSKSLGKEKVEEIKSSYPLGFGKVTDIANACYFLCSSDARWITGQNLIVDGGRTLL